MRSTRRSAGTWTGRSPGALDEAEAGQRDREDGDKRGVPGEVARGQAQENLEHDQRAERERQADQLVDVGRAARQPRDPAAGQADRDEGACDGQPRQSPEVVGERRPQAGRGDVPPRHDDRGDRSAPSPAPVPAVQRAVGSRAPTRRRRRAATAQHRGAPPADERAVGRCRGRRRNCVPVSSRKPAVATSSASPTASSIRAGARTAEASTATRHIATRSPADARSDQPFVVRHGAESPSSARSPSG